MLRQSVRAFGGGHGGPPHDYKYEQLPSKNAKVQVPSPHDEEYQLPKKGSLNVHLHQWIFGKWNVERDNVLDNTKFNKYSLYNVLSNPVMQNGLVLKLLRLHFPGSSSSNLEQTGVTGVTTHENGVFLYKSPQSRDFLGTRVIDYLWLTCFLGFASGASQLLAVPLFVASLSLPRKVAQMRYFTFHAELLPHTEQVCFHKVTTFGDVERIYVDIRNLEKIEADRLPTSLLFLSNTYDSNMIFRCTETDEAFVFDRRGIWNSEALEHPLLY